MGVIAWHLVYRILDPMDNGQTESSALTYQMSKITEMLEEFPIPYANNYFQQQTYISKVAPAK